MTVDLSVQLGRLQLKNPIATGFIAGGSRSPRTPHREGAR
jgi:hypothetical protein